MRRLLAVGLALALLAGLAGCETIKGAGRDIQHAGKAIERAAK